MQVTLLNYPFGYAGTKFTIDKMHVMVRKGKTDPDVIGAARAIVRNCPRKNYHAEAEAIFDFVKRNIRYTRDPNGVELVQSPSVTLRLGHGDCDDAAVLISALCEAVGMRTGFETIRSNPQVPDEFSHVYAIVRTNEGWRAADPTVDESFFGWQPQAGVYGRKIWVV